MSHIMVGSLAAGLAGTFLESKFSLASVVGLGGTSSTTGLPQAFGMTPVILSGMSFWILMHGFVVVNNARKKYSALAEKDGEKDVNERFGYPNLYAQGTSKHVRAFNCVQRSHQQIFENFPQICLLSMVGAVHYPVATAVTLATYAVGRIANSMSYAHAEGDADKRYSHPLSMGIWYGYISTIVVSVVSSVSMIVGKAVI